MRVENSTETGWTPSYTELIFFSNIPSQNILHLLISLSCKVSKQKSKVKNHFKDWLSWKETKTPDTYYNILNTETHTLLLNCSYKMCAVRGVFFKLFSMGTLCCRCSECLTLLQKCPECLELKNLQLRAEKHLTSFAYFSYCPIGWIGCIVLQPAKRTLFDLAKKRRQQKKQSSSLNSLTTHYRYSNYFESCQNLILLEITPLSGTDLLNLTLAAVWGPHCFIIIFGLGLV